MNSNHFDEHIKEQFNDYLPDVHPRIWKKIIAEKDKKRPAGFWVSMFGNRTKLLLVGLFIALSGGAWFYYTANNFEHNITDSEKTANTQTENKTGNTTNSQPDSDNNSTNADIGTNIISSAEDNNIANFNKNFSTAGGFKGRISVPAQQNETDDNKSNIKKENRKHYTGLGNVLVNATSPDVDDDEYAGAGTLLGKLTYNAEKYVIKRKMVKEETPKFNPVVYLPGCPGIEKDAAGNKRYFEFYAGPDYAFRSLQDTGNSAYLQKRKESTQFKSGYSAGVRYTKVFNNSMSVRAGVNYSQINEKFTFNQGNIVQVTYIINSNGDTTGSYTTIGTRHKITTNRYRSIDIPVSIGYEVGNGKLHANINAGAVINIYSWQNGDVLDPSGNPVSITTGKSSSPYQFKTNAGVSFIGAVSVYYKLNEQLHLMAEPYFRYSFSPMSKDDETLKQKYQIAGLRLGIRLDLK